MSNRPGCTFRGCPVRYVSGEDRPCSADHDSASFTSERPASDGLDQDHDDVPTLTDLLLASARRAKHDGRNPDLQNPEVPGESGWLK